MKLRKPFVRLLWLLGTGLLIAPAPGNTGGCGTDPGGEAAEFGEFCLRSRSFRCLREEARGTVVSVQECVDDAAERCNAVGFWPPSCDPAPRQRETDACIDVLRRSDNLNLRLLGTDGRSDLPECRLCP